LPSTVRLEPGDMLRVCGDGALDRFDGTIASKDLPARTAMDADRAGVAAVVAVSAFVAVAAVADVANIIRLVVETTPPDDVTVVAIRRLPCTTARRPPPGTRDKGRRRIGRPARAATTDARTRRCPASRGDRAS
jgi:hypothetical protein